MCAPVAALDDTASCAAVSEIASNEVGLVAVGCYGSGDNAVFSSPDGVEWTSYQTSFSAPSLHVVAGESGFLVTGDPDVVLWSDGGEKWTVVNVDTAPSADPTWAVGPDGLLLQGGTIDGRPMVWTSTDHGRQWKESDVVLPTRWRTDRCSCAV